MLNGLLRRCALTVALVGALGSPTVSWSSELDSPMYEEVPFNLDKNTLELQDVGLTSLVLADTLALAEMADLLGRGDELQELKQRAARLSTALETVWSEETGLYLNRRSDTGKLSNRLSPTLFYPLLARDSSLRTTRR